MSDEEKQAGKAEETKQPASPSADLQKPPTSVEAASKSAAELGDDSPTAITHKVERSTEKLSVGEMAGLPQTLPRSFGGDAGTAQWFRRLPVSMSASELPGETPRWRVELVGLAPAVEPLGLEIVGDTVIGRGRVGTEPADLDLDVYGALEKGVSRRHGMFRPTTNHLYIIDLGSTNGTLHNGIPLGPGVARALKHNDTITLGRFSFTIKIIDGPFIHKTPEPLPAVAINAEEADQTKPMGPLEVSEIRAKKARLAPPAPGSSPGTDKLPADEVAKQQSQSSDAEARGSLPEPKPSAAIEAVPAPQVGLAKTESKPSALEVKPPAAEALSPAAEAKPPAAEDKASDQKAKPLAEEAKPPVKEEKPAGDNPEKRSSIFGE